MIYLKNYLSKNRLFLFWNVGKFAFEMQKRIGVEDKKIANYLQYYFGMTEMFSCANIRKMKYFYLCFPIYTKHLEYLDWNYYLKLISIRNKSLRMFYYQVAIFSRCDYDTFLSLIQEKR